MLVDKHKLVPDSLYKYSRLLLVIVLYLLPVSVSSSSPPFVKDLRKHELLKTGSFNRFVLDCRLLGGDPLPSYSWFKDGSLLTPEMILEDQGLDLVSDREHSQLDFLDPAPHHEGYYHCEANNTLGLARSSVTHVSPTEPSSAPSGTSAPVFTNPPKTEIKSVSSRVELTCEVSGTPTPTIAWFKNGVLMTGETKSKLVIESLDKDDVANYACNASNIAGYEYRNVIVNILTMAAKVREGPKDQTVEIKGSTVTLRCETEGWPTPKLTWSINGNEIVSNDKYMIDTKTGSLTIIQTTMEDAGIYQCRATNHGEDKAEGELIIKDVTTIVSGPSDRTETMGDSIVMECQVVADPTVPLSVTWKKKNTIDLGQTGFEQNARVFQNENNSLVIKNLTFDDSGTYTCVAMTSLDDNPATDTGLLTVVGMRPEIESPARTREIVLEDDTLVLPCHVVQGVPIPTIHWFLNDLPVDKSRVDIQPDNSLVVYSLDKSDTGVFTCKATNSEGSDTIQVDVSVSSRTSINSDPVHVQFRDSFTDGARVVFPCDVNIDQFLEYDEGYTVTWYKDGVQLDPPQQPLPMEYITETEAVEEEIDACEITEEDDGTHMYLMNNHSLVFCSVDQSDVGYYHCEVNTSLEKTISSSYSSVYIAEPFPWWIIIVIIGIILFFILICFICWFRRRKQGKGYYGMDVEDGIGQHNKSDIYYTTEDNESIMDEIDQSMLEKQNGKTPIFTPKTIRRLARVDKSIGSIGSLLDDDEYLDKGYDEDGSFRERYAE